MHVVLMFQIIHVAHHTSRQIPTFSCQKWKNDIATMIHWPLAVARATRKLGKHWPNVKTESGHSRSLTAQVRKPLVTEIVQLFIKDKVGNTPLSGVLNSFLQLWNQCHDFRTHDCLTRLLVSWMGYSGLIILFYRILPYHIRNNFLPFPSACFFLFPV